MSLLQDSLLLQQMNQAQPQQPPQTPFSSGAMAAMDSIRSSLRMDDDQKRNALGMAIARFGSGMANAGNYQRGGGGLGAAALSMGPAIEQYGAANQDARTENMNLMQYLQKLEEQQYNRQRKEKEHNEMMAYRHAQLNESKRYHDLQSGGAGNLEEFYKKQAEGKIPEEALPLANIPANERVAKFKIQQKELENGKEVKNVLGLLREARKLSSQYPDMYSDFNRILYEKAQNPKATLGQIFNLKMIDKDKKTALDKMEKLTSRLVTSEIKSVGGRVASDAMKELIAQGKPNFGLTKDAMGFVIDQMEKEYLPTYEHAQKQRQAMLHGGYIPTHIGDLPKEPPVGDLESPEGTPETAAPPQAQPNDEREFARQALIKSNIPEDKVDEILKLGGY